MNALIRKELRQVLPVQVFIAALCTVAWFGLVDPDEALAPYQDRQASFHLAIAMFAIAEGFVLGIGQFAVERWLGTEAFLIHRGTGPGGAFHAKVAAGCVSLMLLAVLPPAVFGTWHLSQYDYAGSASVARIFQAVLAGIPAFGGYALGVFVAQSRCHGLVQCLLGLTGAVSLLLALFVGVYPSAGPGHASVARHLLVQCCTVAILLGSARATFVAGPHVRGSGSILRGAVATVAFLPALVLVPFWVQRSLRVEFFLEQPHVIADSKGALFVASPSEREPDEMRATVDGEPRRGRVFDLVDEHGEAVPGSLAMYYGGYGRDGDHYSRLFAPPFTVIRPLEEPGPMSGAATLGQPFVFSGPWIQANLGAQASLETSTGSLWVRRGTYWMGHPDHQPVASWFRLEVLGPDTRVLRSVSHQGYEQFLYFDQDTERFRRASESSGGGGFVLEDFPLPAGDRFLGFEDLHDAYAARIGMRGDLSGELVRGERSRYAWNGRAWVRWDEVSAAERFGLAAADELADLRQWSLNLSQCDGISGHVEVRDARTGEPRVSLDLGPRTASQRKLALFTEVSSLAFPPAFALASWACPTRNSIDLSVQRVGPFDVDLLRGRQRTWIPLALAGLATLLVRDLWRRLGHGVAPLGLRLLWCGATALLGLPAYVLCRLLEPRAERAPRTAVPIERREPRFVIRTV